MYIPFEEVDVPEGGSNKSNAYLRTISRFIPYFLAIRSLGGIQPQLLLQDFYVQLYTLYRKFRFESELFFILFDKPLMSQHTFQRKWGIPKSLPLALSPFIKKTPLLPIYIQASMPFRISMVNKRRKIASVLWKQVARIGTKKKERCILLQL